MGFNLGRSQKTYASVGLLMPIIMAIFLALMFIYPQIEGEPQSGVLFYSLKGPGAMHAALFVSLGIGLAVGILAQRSRFCTMGAFRDLILFKHLHLFLGVVALLVAAFAMNLILGQFHPRVRGPARGPQPARLELPGHGPGRSGLRPGPGAAPDASCSWPARVDGDASIFVLGMIVGAGLRAQLRHGQLAQGPRPPRHRGLDRGHGLLPVHRH